MNPAVIAQAAFEGALFLLDAAPVIHRFAERTVTDAVLDRGGGRPLGITLTIDPGGILIVGKSWTRVRGRALDATAAALREYYTISFPAMYRLDRASSMVQLVCELDHRWLSGMTLEGAERYLVEMEVAYLTDDEAVAELTRTADAATLPEVWTVAPRRL